MDAYKQAAMDHRAVAGGVAYGGSIQGYPPEARPKQPTRLETCADHLGKMSNGFAEMNSRLERLANRLAGAVPEADGTTGQIAGAPTSTAHRLESTMEDFGAILRRMDSVVTRIETL